MSQTDDNREDLLDEEDGAAEGEDEDTSSDTDDQDDNDDASDEEGSEEESDDDADGEDSDDEEEDGEEDDDASDEDEEDDESDEDEDGDLDPSGKFKGKSRKDIIKSYRNLERTVGDRAQKLAQEILKKKGLKPTKKDKDEAGGDEGEEFDLGVSDEEIAKMKPREFAQLISRKITEKATEIARNTIERTNEVRQNVRTEIQTATKAHPHLKTNADYRDVVIGLIEAAAAKGEVLTLREACKKADKAMGIKPGKPAEGDDKGGKDGKGKKKPRTAVERAGGTEGGKSKTDEDRVKESLLGGGQSTGSVLGGLY